MREYFLLSDARATAKIVPEDARLAIGRHLAVGRQRAEAADALWSNGHVAEGLRLAAEAFDGTLEALAPFEQAVGPRGELAPEAARVRPPPGIDPTRDSGEDEEPDLAARTEPRDEDAAEQDAADGDAAERAVEQDAAEQDAAEQGAAKQDAAEQDAAEMRAAEHDAAEQDAAEHDASEHDAPEQDAPEQDAPEQDAAAQDAAEASAAEASAAEASEPADDENAADDPAGNDASGANEELAVQPPASSAPLDARADALPDSSEPAWAASFRRRGLSDSKLRAVLETDRALRGKPLPLLDDEVSAAEGELFQQLVTARRHVEGLLSPASMTPGQLAWTRTSRIGFVGLLGAAIVVGLYLLLRPPTGVEATASGQWSAEFTPERAIDDDEASEWLLPDRREGWLDVRIMPAEHIGTLRLKNSHNRHYNDRATNEYTVELFSNGQLVHTIEGSWQGIAPRPQWTEHELDIDDVDRIRVNIRSWHRNGGGLAEIDWE